MGLTELGAKRLIRKLAVIYTRPDTAEDELVRAWRTVLADVDESAISRAVDEYTRSDASYFPKPGKIRSLADPYTSYSAPSRSRVWNGVGPCPTCGASLQKLTLREMGVLEGPDGVGLDDPYRYGVLHDSRRHRAANMPMIGYSDEHLAALPRGEVA